MSHAADIITLLKSYRLSADRETRTQDEVAAILMNASIPYGREVRLTKKDIVDFLCGDVAVEVKVRGWQKREILSQCERYCASNRVAALILVTAIAMGFPPAINGKPCFVVSIGRAWL